MTKRVVQLDPPEKIAEWAKDLGTQWKVVAVDIDRGQLHLMPVKGSK